MQAINDLFAGLNRGLTNIFANPYVTTGLIVFALIFASLAAPNLSPSLVSLFDNNLFKIFYLIFVLVLLQYSVVIGLLAALAFILALQSVHRYRTFSYAQDQMVLAGPTSAMSTAANAYPGLINAATNRVGNFLGNVGHTTYDVGRNIVQVPGQVVSTVGNALTSIPSAFSTSIDSATYVGEGCPVPTSCQNTCGGQPMLPTALPPVENTLVSGICDCSSEGPQGLRFPPGYENLGMGYDITGPVA